MNFEIDDDGYPTDTTLNTITNWVDGYFKLMEFIAKYCNKYGRCEYRTFDGVWEIATGGWSGNEEIIQALKGNRLFWIMTWQLSKRGGYYEFKTKK